MLVQRPWRWASIDAALCQHPVHATQITLTSRWHLVIVMAATSWAIMAASTMAATEIVISFCPSRRSLWPLWDSDHLVMKPLFFHVARYRQHAFFSPAILFINLTSWVCLKSTHWFGCARHYWSLCCLFYPLLAQLSQKVNHSSPAQFQQWPNGGLLWAQRLWRSSNIGSMSRICWEIPHLKLELKHCICHFTLTYFDTQVTICDLCDLKI